MNKNQTPTVAVLMSTYNGSRYIKEQIDSIFAQEEVDVRLFVRDDGSTDNTLEILEEYAEDFSVKILSDGENIGPGESFMRLVYEYATMAGIDYYAFADQDDIWLKDKLQKAIVAISRCNYEGPVLYSSNQYLYINGTNVGERHKERQSTELISHLTRNTIAGCTFVMNRSLIELLSNAKRPDPRIIKYRLHDAWIMLVAIACGCAIYDEASSMLYRIHDDNTVGVRGVSMRKRLDRINRLFVSRDDANLRMITAQELLSLFPAITPKNKEILKLYANYQNTWQDKKRLAFNKDIRLHCGENPIVFTIKVLTNFV